LIEALDEQIRAYLRANKMELDAEFLTTIPEVEKEGTCYILSENGNDMKAFPSVQHLT